jgi:hypothetical protein
MPSPSAPSITGTTIFSTAIPAAALQGMTANHYYWLTNANTLIDAGTVATALTGLTNACIVDTRGYDEVNVYAYCTTLTGSTGGTLSLANLWPGAQAGLGPAAVLGVQNWSITTGTSSLVKCVSIAPNMVQSQSSGNVDITSLATSGGRIHNAAFTLFFSLAPNPASTFYVAVVGF